jgi:hypothetical protein
MSTWDSQPSWTEQLAEKLRLAIMARLWFAERPTGEFLQIPTSVLSEEWCSNAGCVTSF